MNLAAFFQENPRGALAFSGGVDSSLLVWAAKEYGVDWRAYYVHTAFQPAFELADAQKIAHQCHLPLTVIEGDILRHREVAENPADRCYHCKGAIFSLIRRQAAADGYHLLIDGTNASDDDGDRPGMRALREMAVRSPLRECGLTKAAVRAACRAAGLFVWNKPAYACLATRIPTGTALTREALEQVETGESLAADLGLRDFRIRLYGGVAVLQVTQAQMADVLERREEFLARLGTVFPLITLDLTPRRAST